jgi:signal transduction histidine kinase
VIDKTESGLFAAFVGITGGLELASTLRRIVEEAVELTSSTYGALGVLGVDGEVTEFIHVGLHRDIAENLGEPPQGKGILGVIIEDPRALRLEDLSKHPASVGFPTGHPPMHSFLGVPVRVGGSVFGNLYLTEKRNGEFFTDEDERLVGALAAAAAVAIENARLYESSRRREEWQQAVAEIANTVLSSVDGQEVVPLLAHHARAISGADACVVATPDSLGNLVAEVVEEYDPHKIFRSPDPRWAMHRSRQRTLRSAAFDNLARDWIGHTVPASSLLHEAMQKKQTLRQTGALLNIDQPRTFGSIVAIPMVSGDQAIAVFALIWDIDVMNPNPDALESVKSFAAQAAVTLVLAESQREHERLAIYEDRDRIARDLHDLVIQRLFATGMSLQGALRSGEPDEGIEGRISRAVDELDETIREIRQTIFALHEPTSGPASGVRGKVLRETTQSGVSLGFNPSVRFVGPVDTLISDQVSDHLIAALREALSNAMKHAQARRIDVMVEVDPATVVLMVTDDGVGVSPLGPSRRSGIANLSARAQDLGGACSVERATDKGGTRLVWRVPIG